MNITPLGYGIVSGFCAIGVGIVILALSSSGDAIAEGIAFVVAGSIFAGAGVYRWLLLRRRS